MSENDSYYEVIVKTNSYAGNFEREMCAYCTGVIGECGVGEDFADMFMDEEDPDGEKGYIIDQFTDLMYQMPDDHGCHRPVNCGGPQPTVGWVRMFMYEIPTYEQLSLIMERAKKFAEEMPNFRMGYNKDFQKWTEPIKIEGFQVIRVDIKRVETDVTDDIIGSDMLGPRDK